MAQKPTAMETVGCDWRYALLVMQVRNDDSVLHARTTNKEVRYGKG